MDFIKSLQLTLPPTPRPRWFGTGLVVSIKSAPLEGLKAHHDEDGCVVCCVDVLILIYVAASGSFIFPTQTQIDVKLLRERVENTSCYHVVSYY